jgi:hypothetical protein
MKKLLKKLEDIMVAVTFAEAGEYDEASRLSGDERPAQEDLGKPLSRAFKRLLRKRREIVFHRDKKFLSHKKHYKDRSN